MQGKILIIYYHDFGYPLRTTSYDMLHCFERYSGCICYYVNAAFGIPKYLQEIDFDVIVYDNLLASKRSFPYRMEQFLEHSDALLNISGVRIGFAQDEYFQTHLLQRLINEHRIKYFFTLAGPSEQPKIFDKVDRTSVTFHTVLTGYLDSARLAKVDKLLRAAPPRSIDIGYRAWNAPYYLGHHGVLKAKIADVFQEEAERRNLKVDISLAAKSVLLGDDWWKFLLRCKSVIGVEGGSSVLDPNGDVALTVHKFMLSHPDATFEETREACFPGLDGLLDYRAISPRHLESCAARNCQILIEGDYNGILKPSLHYIPVRSDFSNLDEVFEAARDEKLRSHMIDRAYADVIESGKYTIDKFVKDVLEKSIGKNPRWSPITERDKRLHAKVVRREQRLWAYIRVRSYAIKSALKMIPDNLLQHLIAQKMSASSTV